MDTSIFVDFTHAVYPLWCETLFVHIQQWSKWIYRYEILVLINIYCWSTNCGIAPLIGHACVHACACCITMYLEWLAQVGRATALKAAGVCGFESRLAAFSLKIGKRILRFIGLALPLQSKFTYTVHKSVHYSPAFICSYLASNLFLHQCVL